MISLVIPTYRERENLDALFARLEAVQGRLGEPLEVLVVDSASDDGTAAYARTRLGGRLDGRVIECPRDVGLAEAVVVGAAQARGERLAVMDADLSHPPELLPELVQAVRDGHEVAVASRYVSGGRITNWPLARRLASWFANQLARPLVPVADATSGYFLCRRALVTSLTHHPSGFKILLDLFVWGGVRNVREIPYTFTDRARGASKLNGRTMWAFLVQMASLYRRRCGGS